MLVFKKKQTFQLFLVLLKRTAFLAVLFLLLAPGQKVSAVGFEEVCRGAGAGVCDSGLECDSAEDICLGSNGYVCQDNKDCANGLSCLSNHCAVDKGEQQGEKFGLGKSTSDIRDQIRTFINIFLGFLGVLGVLMIIYGGLLWMTSRGNAEQVKKAKQTLTYTVLGMLVILLSWTITSYILHLGAQVGGNGGGNGGGGGPPILPVEPGSPGSLSLEIEEFGAQHQGQDPQIDVYPSCGINIDFNLYIDPSSVDKTKNINLASPLRVEKADMQGMAVRDFLTTANRVTYPPKKWIDSQGQPQTGADLALDTRYQVVLPGILDTAEHPAIKNNTQQYLLQNCQGDLQNVCTIIGSDIYWYFTTAKTEENLPKVSLVSSAPADQARNIPTYPSIILKFNGELFVPSFLNNQRFKNNIKILQTNDGECNIADLNCLVADSPASIAENWETYLDGQIVSFYYRPTPRAELEPFSWYYFQAENILDICGQNIIGNIDQSSKIILRFQVGEGAKFIVYPPDGADTLCPGGVPIYAQSTISLFDPINGQCGYGVDGSLGPVDGSLDPAAGRRLIVQDPGLGGCTKYDFLPLEAALSENKEYHAHVSSEFFITKDETLKADWQFSTISEGLCDNPPAITQISPESGFHGQCLGIIGHGFVGKSDLGGAHKTENLISFVKKDSPDETTQNYEAVFADPINGSWSDNNIVTIFPKDNFVKNDQVIISMQRYSEAVGKILTTVEVPIFTLSDDQIIDEPLCLTAIELIDPLSPALAGKKIKLVGKNFSDKNLTPHENCAGEKNCVKFNNDTLLVPSYYWTDVSAESSIPGQALTGANLVFVHKIINPGTQDIKSNGYLFTVDLPSPEKPQVVYYLGCDNNRFQTPSPYPDKTDVCLIDYSNEQRVIFFLEYDRQIQIKEPVSFLIEDCGKEADPNCQGNFIPNGNYQLDDGQAVVNPDHPDHEGLKITMTGGSLSANKWYQANLQSGVTDTADSPTLADPFIWSFKTNDKICEIDKVNVSLNPEIIDYSFDSPSNASATSATAINTATCQQLDTNLFTWNWSVEDTQIATINSDDHDAENIATATGKKGKTKIEAKENSSEITGSAVLEVSTGDPTLCDPHIPEGCEKNNLCQNSKCVRADDEKDHCTPVINTLSPTAGPAGTWLEINGCYFGEEKGATGKVDFNGEADGIFDPSHFPKECNESILWTNEKILTEVPAIANLEKKPVKIITSLSLRSNADQEFNLTNDPLLPQLCAVIPDEGKVETAFTAIGKFNDQAINTTGISIGGKGSSGAVENKNEIKTQVAQDASLGEQVVKVIQDGKKSPQDNIKFTVLSNKPPIAPAQTFIKILNYSPKADNVCQNAVVSMEFDTTIKEIEDLITLEPNQCAEYSPTPVAYKNNRLFAFLTNLLKKMFFISKAQTSTECGEWQFKEATHKEIEIKLEQTGKYLKEGVYTIKVKGGADGVKNEDNKILNKDNCGKGIWQDPYCVYTFSGGTNICEADRVTINSDVGEVFVYNVNYDHSNPPAGSYTDLIVTGYVKEQEINLIAPYYTPPVSWQVLPKSNIIKLYYANNSPAPQDTVEIAYAVEKGEAIIQGSDVVKAVVKVGEKELVDTIVATLALCEGNSSQYFWKFDDPLNTATYPDPPGNFSLSYCRYQTDKPENPLPLISIKPTFPQPNQISKNAEMDILKEYYFKFVPEQGESDATFLQKPYAKDFFIFRIMPNWEQDYLSDWFIKEKDNLTGITRPPAITKQSAYAYEQADGGNILFVNALNLVKDDPTKGCDQTDCKMFTNVYILSYNEDAQDETKTIFNQLKTNWQFNINFLTDKFLIAVNQEKIQRDWQRIRDLNLVAVALEKYKDSSSGKYPYYNVLDIGVRPLGIAVSKWQQEWSKLGTELAMSLPYDPINIIQCKGTKGEQSSECFYQPGETGEKRGAYYCQAHRQCSDYKEKNDCELILNSNLCEWEAVSETCNDIEGNTGTYAYQYQLTGECYRYDEVEVKCSQKSKSECDIVPKDCVWRTADTKEPKIRTKDQCESLCSSDGFTLADYCDWDIQDGRCYSSAQSYILYANLEYSPNPWCQAKTTDYCKEYSFCHLENSECKATALTLDQQPLCSDYRDQVFNVRYFKSLAGNTEVPPPSINFLYGDLTRDGYVLADDWDLFIKILNGDLAPSNAEFSASDFNKNNRLEQSDIYIFSSLLRPAEITQDKLPILLGDVNLSGSVTDDDIGVLNDILGQDPSLPEAIITWQQFLSADVDANTADDTLTQADVDLLQNAYNVCEYETNIDDCLKTKLPPP